jgi:protein arginine kinase activator
MEEKPIECSLCQRESVITYKEVVNGKILSSKMCASCPLLMKKLGLPTKNNACSGTCEKKEVLCTSCQTTLEAIQTGGRLGCPACYQVFEKTLIQELTRSQELYIRDMSMSEKDKNLSFHLGKIPDKLEAGHLSIRLESLQAALGEAIALENYEKAAGIRDQIKLILEGTDAREPNT